jgi:tRNA(adenine34) deaminase
MIDTAFMRLALAQAQAAAAAGEVPVGAVVVKNGEVIAVGRNGPIHANDPTAHAEIQALRAASLALGNYRLDGCEMFVTLEPCAMCSGAMLHARLDRVVYGAKDPKTGAAGSVIDLFAQSQLNHHTRIQGGVMAEACAAVLQEFFQIKREAQSLQRRAQHPLRDDALRTPDSCFLDLPAYPWQPCYVNDMASLAGLRMHYLDEGSKEAPRTFLCLHGTATWSYSFRNMIPDFLKGGCRVVAPDLIGFGKSDKPKRETSHLVSFHRQTLLELVGKLDLHNVILVVQEQGGYLGLTLPMAEPERFIGLLVLNSTLNPEGCAAHAAPFPDRGYRAATRAFRATPPDGATLLQHAREFWRTRWQGQVLVATGAHEPIAGPMAVEYLQEILGGRPEAQQRQSVGSFDSEWDMQVAKAAVAHFTENRAQAQGLSR